jgi:alpha-tubulin suppressor-like RCC1 family protein
LVNTETNVIALARGAFLGGCLLDDVGGVSCWSGYDPPEEVAGVSAAVAVTRGTLHQCAILSDRTVGCWGANDLGQLGDGDTNPSDTPQAVIGVSDAIAISAHEHRTCALLEDETVWCWGDGSATPSKVAGF